MEARDKHINKTIFDKDYINEINWDFLFFRALLIMGSIALIGLLVYFLWFME